MQKSFKKAIACLLAVLMVAFAMPFSAFAAVGDYEPDVQLHFTPFFEEYGNNYAATSANGYTSSGLCAFPLTYKNGTLSATAEDINVYQEYWEYDTVDEGWTLGEGDYFIATVILDNIDIAAAGNILIRFSDNITPAGFWQTGKGNKAKYGFSNINEIPSGATLLAGYESSFSEWSATDLYGGGEVFNTVSDLNGIYDDPAAVEGDGWSDSMIRANFVGVGDYVEITPVGTDNGFFDYENHVLEDDGFTYDGRFIVASFAFQITDEGPIEFTLQDPEGTIDTDLMGAAYFAKKSEGMQTANATTYAPNGENPGSMKMTFMGKNTNKGEEPQTETYTIVFKDKNGDVISSTDYEADAEVTIPALPANTYDDTYHYSYAWDATPSATATATATYQVVETAEEHDFAAVTDPASTCTVAGTITYTCDCGKTYTEDAPLAAHTPGTAVKENDVPSTCNTLGGYDEVVYCTVCNAEISRNHVNYTEYAAHTPGTAVKENDVPSTCNTLGGYDEVVYCTVCNAEISRNHVDYTEYAAHTPADAVKENEVAATKKDRGSYDSVVYCSVCKGEISRETIYTDALGVTVTLNASDIGTVTGLEAGANKLAYGTEFTLTATPIEGATFVGWEVGGNIVSKDASYTTKAVSDITITPVFEDAAAETITVTFYDKYGNTVKQYKDMEVAAYQAAIAAEFDSIVAPTYPSYAFKAWDKTKDEILAIEASTTIWAEYEKALTTAYTVTTDAELVLPDGVVNGSIPYDTMVTVRDADATAWTIGTAVVAYGTEYSFYVGSDVEVQPVYETVEEAATVTVIGANLVAGSEYKYNLVATRNIPDGFTLVDYGFVYGKNLTDADLDLDNVGNNGSNADSGVVKAVHGGTRNSESNEFAFNYGIKAKNAPITAKAFVTVTNKDGETEIVYSDMFVQNY